MQVTTDAEVNEILEMLLNGVKGVLGERLVGMYVYGSLASGDFNLQTSDIDFLVVVDGEPPFEPLRDLHALLLSGGNAWAAKLEGGYVPLQTLRRHDPAAPAFPCTNEGKFYMAQMEDDWAIRRHLLRKAAIVLAGPPVAELIDPVAPEAMRQALRGFLEHWWMPMVEKSPGVPYRLDDAEYQRYAVLTMCRMLNTHHTGDFVSKAAAGRWALQALDERWHALIQRSLDWQPGEGMGEVEETVGLICYTNAVYRTEKEKMLAGEIYNCLDPDLEMERQKTKKLLRLYNQSESAVERWALLQQVLGQVGENSMIESPFHCVYGKNIYIGDHVYLNVLCTILDCNRVEIGNHVMIGPGVQIYTAAHLLQAEGRNQGLEEAKAVVIEDNVWLGGSAILLPGVRIDRNAVVGAGAVVSRDVPANTVVAGNPARVIREIEQ